MNESCPKMALRYQTNKQSNITRQISKVFLFHISKKHKKAHMIDIYLTFLSAVLTFHVKERAYSLRLVSCE